MKKKLFAIILSSLGLIAHANQIVFVSKEDTTHSPSAVKNALAILLSEGLIAKDTSSGKYFLDSTDLNALQIPNNIQSIDMDSLESEMKTVHTTDF